MQRVMVKETHMQSRRQFLGSAAVTAMAASWPLVASAQRNLDLARILCGFPAGGTSDGAARRLAESLRSLGYAKQIIVENKVGAGGRLAFDEMRRGTADGSLMVLQPETVITLQPHTDPKNTTFKFEDGAPVGGVGIVNYGFAVGPAVPPAVKSMKDFLDWAKANPAAANFGTPGAGSPQEFFMKLMAKEVGVALNPIPYRGSAPGVQDLLAGQIAAMYSPVGDSLPHRASGKMRLIATSGAKRSRFAADVPTFSEQGFDYMVSSEWYGVWVPRATPDTAVEQLNLAIKAAFAQPETVEVMNKLAVEAEATSVKDFAAAMRANYVSWPERVRRTGFKLD
jgi:tripartite-type tricarboxylate transporter receptor subunit TctC